MKEVTVSLSEERYHILRDIALATATTVSDYLSDFLNNSSMIGEYLEEEAEDIAMLIINSGGSTV